MERQRVKSATHQTASARQGKAGQASETIKTGGKMGSGLHDGVHCTYSSFESSRSCLACSSSLLAQPQPCGTWQLAGTRRVGEVWLAGGSSAFGVDDPGEVRRAGRSCNPAAQRRGRRTSRQHRGSKTNGESKTTALDGRCGYMRDTVRTYGTTGAVPSLRGRAPREGRNEPDLPEPLLV